MKSEGNQGARRTRDIRGHKLNRPADSQCQAVVTVSERSGSRKDRAHGSFAVGPAVIQRSAKFMRNRRLMKSALNELQRPMARQALAALGHPMRVRILAKLLEGTMVYQAMKKLTRLQPGPLYHHINQLRLSGLVNSKERNLYELTRGGRNLILVTLAARTIIVDRRDMLGGASDRYKA